MRMDSQEGQDKIQCEGHRWRDRKKISVTAEDAEVK